MVIKIRVHHIPCINVLYEINHETSRAYRNLAHYKRVIMANGYSMEWFNDILAKFKFLITTDPLVQVISGEPDIFCEKCNQSGCAEGLASVIDENIDDYYAETFGLEIGRVYQMHELVDSKYCNLVSAPLGI